MVTTQAATACPRTWAVDMTDDPDLALVQQTLKGDPEAFSALVRLHQNLVYNLAYRFMRDPTLAEDMTQEAFLKAFRLLKSFRGDSTFSTWMYRVTCNVCLTELKRRKRLGEILRVAPWPPHTNTSEPERADLAESIRRCVTKLPAPYATAITLYYLKGISYEEIADIMKIPQGTLKTWMYRAREKLRKLVQQELNADD